MTVEYANVFYIRSSDFTVSATPYSEKKTKQTNIKALWLCSKHE